MLVSLLIACATARPPGPALPPEVPEPSTLVASSSHPGVLWTHGDSGNAPRLYAVDAEGRLRGTVDVDGATAVDWEESTTDGAGHLWVGDIGNNFDTRRDLVVYRVPEPAPRDGRVAVDRAVRFRYPDQVDFPPANRRFDAEAMFWWDGTLWLLTKHRDDAHTTLYRFPALEGDVVLERVEDLDLQVDPKARDGRVTAAALDAAGERLAVLTYDALYVFGRPDDGRSWLSRRLAKVVLDRDVVGQCEGVAWDGGAVIVGNEAGALLRVADPLATPRFPVATQGR